MASNIALQATPSASLPPRLTRACSGLAWFAALAPGSPLTRHPSAAPARTDPVTTPRRHRAAVLACALFVSCATQSRSTSDDRTRLLALHAEVMSAHRLSNVELMLRADSQDYVVANRGEISRPTVEERRAQFSRYLGSTRFDEYVDVAPPTVMVSRDGTLGWVIVQVRARGEQTAENGAKKPITFESAWVELYEKRGNEWLRVGNLSNFKP